MMNNYIKGFVVPPYWRYNEDGVFDAQFDRANRETSMPGVCPLSIKLSSESDDGWWSLPIEPIIAVSGKNNIVKRDVLKVLYEDNERRGSVKELWSQGDYEINISGVFQARDGQLPIEDISRLRSLCEARETIDVKSQIFTTLGITRIAIEDFQFPFTKGLENQVFIIKAYSDSFDVDELLIKE